MPNALVTQAAVEPGILERVYADGTKTYRAEVWDNRAKRRKTKTFPTRAAARSWRSATSTLVRSGEAGVVPRATVEQAAWCLLEAAHEGRLGRRGGEPYRRSVLLQYEGRLRIEILPRFRNVQLADLDAPAVQAWVDDLRQRMSASSVQNTLMPLRVIYRAAIQRGFVKHNPTTSLDMPQGSVARDRIATPEEAERLIAALPRAYDRALWATAVYAGLRAGELAALRWEDIDWAARLIRVQRAYNERTRETTAPKTKKGRREALLPAPLLPYLVAVRQPSGLVFPGSSGLEPFVRTPVYARANKVWDAAGLPRIALHECRHTCASWMIAAGVNIKQVSERMGHSSVTITLDRYGHLLPGGELEALGLLEEFLGRDRRAA